MARSITAAQVRAIAGPSARPELVSAVVRGWPTAVAKAKLTNRLRACHFLAQIMTETGGLQVLSESGAYRAEQIEKTFGVGHHSAAVTGAEARRIAALPVAQRGPVLFNRVYGVGNPKKMREFGNTGPNDGWLYRGGGMMQATGKSNYAAMEKKTGLPLVAHPELLHNPDSAFLAAYLEWAQDGRCNAAADNDSVKEVRWIINGGKNGLPACKAFLAKAREVLVNYDAVSPATAFAEPDDEPPADDNAGQDEAVTADGPGPAVVDPDAIGDPDLFSTQRRLKAMNYNPGIVSGVWGGMTAGAISGFINDRHAGIPAPTSIEMFEGVHDKIRAELSRAEADQFVRPVTEARASGDPKTVAAVAPAVVPVKRNFLVTAWASAVAFLTWLYNLVSDSVASAWNFYTDHKDNLPTDPSFLGTVWEYVGKVPTSVWIFAAAAGLGLLALNARNGVKTITESVKTGALQ